jgi:hypothetical protein
MRDYEQINTLARQAFKRLGNGRLAEAAAGYAADAREAAERLAPVLSG